MMNSATVGMGSAARRRPLNGYANPEVTKPFPAFLSHPYAIAYAGFMTIMVAISFDIPAVSTVAYKLRWPVMGLFAVAGILRALTVPGYRVSLHYKFQMFFIFLAGATAFAARDPSYSFQRSISLTLLFGASAVGLCHYCTNRANLVAFTDAVWCIGAFMVATGFVFRTGDIDSTQRFVGLQNSATGAGTYAALFLPIALYQVRYRFRGIMLPIGWLVVALMLVQPVLASARTALLISFIVGSALCFDYFGRKAVIATAVFACFMPLALLLDTRTMLKLHDKADKVIREKSIANFTGRLDRWKFGVEQWWKKPVFGHGLGASRKLAGEEEPHRFNLQPGEVFNWHSDQVEILCDLGAVGSLTFNLMWLSIALAGFKVAIAAKSAARQIALAYLGSISYAFVDTFMHGGFVAAGGGTSTYTWSFIAVFSAIVVAQFGRRQVASRSRSTRANANHRQHMPSPASIRQSEWEQKKPARQYALLPSMRAIAGERRVRTIEVGEVESD